MEGFSFAPEPPSNAVTYNRALPGYGEKMPIDVWKQYVEDGYYMDIDGFAYACKEDMLSNRTYTPSQAAQLPLDATHVLWLNN
jgi:hypothetical protein